MSTVNDESWETRPFRPDWVVHPGETVKDAMEERGWSDTYTALRLGWTLDDLRALLEGRASIAPPTAYLLGTLFETSPQFWSSLQRHYDSECQRLGINSSTA